MSILATKDTHVVIQGGVAGVNAARRMAEFRYMIKQPLNVSAFVYPPDAGKTNEIVCGTELVAVPFIKQLPRRRPTIRKLTRVWSISGRTEPMKGPWMP